MASATTTTTTEQLAADMLAQSHQPYAFSFTPFLQATYQHGLPADRPICKAYSNGHCPAGTRCPNRHVASMAGGKQEGGGEGRVFNSMVCKHWLRGLCKKGESCEFLHEYNLRKMPECNFYVRNGYCSNGDECLYLHIDPLKRLPPCPAYDAGFCPQGPLCAKRHLRRRLCPYYLAGFCPDGPACKQGVHPRWDPKGLEKQQAAAAEEAVVAAEKKTAAAAAAAAAGPGRGGDYDAEEDRERDRDRDRDHDRDWDRGDRSHDRQGYKDKFGGPGGRGGGGGRWRNNRGGGGGAGGGGYKFRGRG